MHLLYLQLSVVITKKSRSLANNLNVWKRNRKHCHDTGYDIFRNTMYSVLKKNSQHTVYRYSIFYRIGMHSVKHIECIKSCKLFGIFLWKIVHQGSNYELPGHKKYSTFVTQRQHLGFFSSSTFSCYKCVILYHPWR